MQNKLFSIQIPTCNRADSLKETLKDLIPKVKRYNIGIYVNDNNSQDKTAVYVKDCMQEYKYLHYNKVEISSYEEANVHISAEKNMQAALALGESEYRLLLGDHYILYDESSIEALLESLEKRDLDGLILHHNRRTMARNNDFIYEDRELFLEDLGWYISMVSTVVYHKDVLEKMNFEKYYGTNYGHTLALLDYIATHNFRLKYIHKVTTWTTKGGVKGLASWHAQVLEIFTKSWYEGIMSIPDTLSNASKLRCIKNHYRYNEGFYSWKSLIFYRYAGGITINSCIKYLPYLKKTAGYAVVGKVLLIALVPKIFIPYFFKESYAYIQRVLGNIDKYDIK